MRNSTSSYYLDGFAYIYSPKENYSSFKAKKNISSLEDMMLKYKLPFAQMSKRLQDIEFAESVNRDLNLKIKSPLVNSIKDNDKVVINGILYDIVYIDEDRLYKHLFIYLEEVGPIE